MYLGPLSEQPVDLDTGKTLTDIQTSKLTPRLAEDGEHIREFSPVLHNQPLREIPAVNSAGKRFGTNILPEPLSMSAEQARAYLAAFYGLDVADSMIGRAVGGTFVNGTMFKVQDTQASTKGKMSVTTDKSRPGSFVISLAILKQSGGKRT